MKSGKSLKRNALAQTINADPEPNLPPGGRAK